MPKTMRASNDLKTKIDKLMLEFIEQSNIPDLKTYRNKFVKKDKRESWFIRHIMDLGDIYNARVLDIGCGFGFEAIQIALMGNNQVVANDIRELMISIVNSLVGVIKSYNYNVNVETFMGDICSATILPASFDVACCFQAIEHIHDLEALFVLVRRILRKKGRFIIVNDNNLLNAKQVAKNTLMWKLRDESYEFIKQLKKERPLENIDTEPYAVLRERIVRGSNPALSKDAIIKIVYATRGMTKNEIEKISRQYSSEKMLPTAPPSSCCRNPITGEYCERLLDPYELCDMLRRIGFKAHVRHIFRKFPLNFFNGVSFLPLNRFLFNLRPVFIIVANND